ncbi:substrate-binding periplasmic protein [Stutzerimonas azotifigens]|uniref:substrate-binding periplasmic protein n=1 Tax=Stutzerimonas azotifigens TaxID=291995 RepID=UPI00042346B5|nr:transporter substrate-binding domain-containing protein [Stutzerimonas azotifigens]
MTLPITRTLLLLSLLVTAATTRAQTAEIVLLTQSLPPFSVTQGGKNFARDDGVRGVSTETLREVFRRAGVSYSITLRFPWERLYQQALQQAGHGLYSTVMSDARRNQFKWVGPIAHYDVVLVATADSTLAPASLEQVRGRRIGGYKFGGPSERLAAQGVQTVDALSDSANIRKLLDGEIDLWATADPVWRQYAEQEGAKGLKVVLRLGTEPLYLALNKATPDALVQRLQKAMDAVIAEGSAGCRDTPDLCYLVRERRNLASAHPLPR